MLKHALDIIPEGRKVAFFLRVLFLEGKERGRFFKENPPKKIYVASGRLTCAKMVSLKNTENLMLKRMLGSFGKKVLKVNQL